MHFLLFRCQPRLSARFTCLIGMFLLISCGGTNSVSEPTIGEPATPSPTPDPQPMGLIKVNQIGYLPSLSKIAIVPESTATGFDIVDELTGALVYTGNLSSANNWSPAAQSVQVADFSDLTASGQYSLRIDGFENVTVNVAADSYLALHDGALKAYYFNRASIALLPEYAADWARPLGHPDNEVQIHASAASSQRPEGTIISAPKGWYDAGDYNKYVVNSGISTYTLLAAYAHYAAFYQDRKIGIPESENQVPDILDEIMWNLDWMQAMQDPNDGGVYHKLTTQNFSAAVMPHQAQAQRFVVQKNAAASLNFSAVMAMSARVYKAVPEFAAKVPKYRQAAIDAFAWALANPALVYQQPDDIKTGEYGDNDLAGEFAWAAAELYLLTGQATYLEGFNQFASAPTTPWWQDTMGLAYMSLLSEGLELLAQNEYEAIQTAVLSLADEIVTQHQSSAYLTAMLPDEFIWGSNSVALNKAMMLMQAYRAASAPKYLQAATGLVDYVLGKNPLDMSYVTGFGLRSPMDPHHRQSYADTVAAPVPGFLAGGPHTGRQDGCDYQGNEPATTYIDDWCSYATNEVTINWNAPLVYILAALHNSQ